MTAAAYQLHTVGILIDARLALLVITLHDALARESGFSQSVVITCHSHCFFDCYIAYSESILS